MNILVLHTGGTISCSYENGVLSPHADIVPIINGLFKNERDVRLSHKRLAAVLSENTDGRILNKIAFGVAKHVLSGKYDGVIVTVGSDTLAYTSAAISYAVGLSKTPVITVSSSLPLTDPNADGILNLRAAVAVIRSKKALGALTVYSDGLGSVSVFRASRITQQPPYVAAPCPSDTLYGCVRNGVFTKSSVYSEGPDGLNLSEARFSTISPVALIKVYPGMIYPTLPRRIKAVILLTYPSGTVNTASDETSRFAKKCKKRGIRVYVSGIRDSADYESMAAYTDLGFIRLPVLTSPEAMLIKLWLLNSDGRAFSDIKLLSSLGGDLPLKGTEESKKA